MLIVKYFRVKTNQTDVKDGFSISLVQVIHSTD